MGKHELTFTETARLRGETKQEIYAKSKETNGLSLGERRKKLNQILHRAVTATDVREIAINLMNIAKNPDHKSTVQAANLVFDRVIGVPDQHVTVDIRAVVGSLTDEQLINALKRSSGETIIEIETEEQPKILPENVSQGNPLISSSGSEVSQSATEGEKA